MRKIFFAVLFLGITGLTIAQVNKLQPSKEETPNLKIIHPPLPPEPPKPPSPPEFSNPPEPPEPPAPPLPPSAPVDV